MKKIIALLMWLVGSVAFAQSIQGTSPSVIAIDGSNTTYTKVLSLPQIQPTIVYNASPTPSPIVPQPTQVSNWFQLNGNQAILVEAQSNTFAGYYGVQVSNNPTPISTAGAIISTPMRDDATWSSGGAGAQTLSWASMLKEGYRWIRFFCTPESGNGGTLNFQARLFGNPTTGDAYHTYTSGVPWKSAEVLVPSGTTYSAGGSTAVNNYFEYKLPQGAKGINLYTNYTNASGAATILTTIYSKDPVSGQLQALAVGTSTHAANFNTINLGPGYNSPYPVATPPTGETIVSQGVAQDLVIGNAISGAGTITYGQTIVPIQ